jgi:tetratricopeptide (TPR) repeat protein
MTVETKTRSRIRLGMAAAAFGAFLAAQPGLAQARNTLGVAETSAGNFLAALAADARNDAGAAAHYFREALRADPRNTALQERAFIAALQDGAMPEAFRLGERLLQRDANNALAHMVMGVRAMKNRQFITARSHFQKAGGRGRNADLTAALLVAWTHVGSGETRRALEIVDRFSDPQLAIYRNLYGGMMADVGGDVKEAAKRLKAAHAVAGDTIRVADAYARFEARHGDKAAAKAIYDKIAERPAQRPFVERAKKAIDAGQTPDPFVLNAVQGAAEILYTASESGRRGAEMISVMYLQLSNHLNADHDMTLVSLAENFEQLKQFERAIGLYNRVPEDSPIKTRSVIRAAYALNEMKKADEAIKLIEERIAKSPFEVNLHEAAAAIHRGAKNWTAATEASTRAIALVDRNDRNYWSLFYGRGISQERGKQWPAAEADLKHALSLLPATPRTEEEKASVAHVLNHIAYTWVDMGIHIDEAFPMLKRAVELQPKDAHIIDSLGWAYYKLGRYEEAVVELEKAVDLRPQDSVLNDHLGDAYWKVGRTNEARFQWNHARDLNPEPDELEKILEKIRNGLDQPKAAETETPKKPDGG